MLDKWRVGMQGWMKRGMCAQGWEGKKVERVVG